jgi:hypothetical protein
MVYIEQNTTNTIFVNVSQFKVLSNPYYLWRLQNAQTREITSFIPYNATSTYPSQYANKYDVFQFNTFENQPTNYIYTTGDVNLNLKANNEYWLGIYETPILSTNVNYAEQDKLLTSLAFIFVSENNQFYSGNTQNTANNIIYNPNA